MASDAVIRARWRRAAVQVGVVAAPAGLNYVVSGTTYWIYDQLRVATDALTVRSTGVRVPLDADGVSGQLAALRIVDALWTRVALPVPRRTPHGFGRLIQRLALPRKTFDLGRFLHRSAIALEWIGLFGEYAEGGLYHADFTNGITFLLVSRD